MGSRVVGTATVRAVGRKLLGGRAALVLTPAAVAKVRRIVEENSERDWAGLRIGVRQRGCNGLSYTLDLAEGKGERDEVVVQDGVTVFVDRRAQLSLLGTEMDYREDELSSEFVFNNPNVKGTCGCGESFSL